MARILVVDDVLLALKLVHTFLDLSEKSGQHLQD